MIAALHYVGMLVSLAINAAFIIMFALPAFIAGYTFQGIYNAFNAGRELYEAE